MVNEKDSECCDMRGMLSVRRGVASFLEKHIIGRAVDPNNIGSSIFEPRADSLQY